MAAAIEKQFQTQSTLIEGRGGIFDVVIDGKMIFSKKKVGRFPEHSEILDAISGGAKA